MPHPILGPFCILLFATACNVAFPADPPAAPAAQPAAEETWSYAMAYSAADKGALLRLGFLTAIYEGEDYGGTASGSMSVFGNGSTASKSGALTLASAPNEVHVSFRGKSFTVTQRGQGLKVGGHIYTLDATAETKIRFAKDGAATVTCKEVKLGGGPAAVVEKPAVQVK